MNKEILLARKCHFSVALGTVRTDGANVLLEVLLNGRLDPQTDLSVNLGEVDRVLKEYLSLVDHKHIAKDLRPMFSQLSQVTEGNDKLFLLYLSWEFLQPKLNYAYASLGKIRLRFGEFEELSWDGV